MINLDQGKDDKSNTPEIGFELAFERLDSKSERMLDMYRTALFIGNVLNPNLIRTSLTRRKGTNENSLCRQLLAIALYRGALGKNA